MNTKFALQLLCVICSLQIIFTAYLIIKIYASSVVRPDQDYAGFAPEKSFDLKVDEVQMDPIELPKEESGANLNLNDEKRATVAVLGKAAIASYFWEHIFGGIRAVDADLPGIISGHINFSNFSLRYVEGPALLPMIFPHTSEKIILIANGRTQEKVFSVREWLHSFTTWHRTPDVFLFLLGNEKCENGWIKEFLPPNGPVRSVFLTYDDPAIDDKMFFQWPLGVATYRHFPLLKEEQLDVPRERKYLCNIQATNYLNSTRSLLFELLEGNKLARDGCYVAKRSSWKASESPDSMNEYIWYLIQSDLTLCPAGFNGETYRVYEAMAAGSIPVVEDSSPGGLCDTRGWRLLKEFQPPVIWIKDWGELPALLRKEKRKSLEEKIERRKQLLQWYASFKIKMKERVLSLIYERLLNPD